MEEDKRVAMKYKKVANKTRPVATTLPEEYHIVRRLPAEPLKELPVLPINPGVFTPGEQYTQERYEAMEINPKEGGGEDGSRIDQDTRETPGVD